MKILGQMFHCYGSDEQPFVNQQMINVDAIRGNNNNLIHLLLFSLAPRFSQTWWLQKQIWKPNLP